MQKTLAKDTFSRDDIFKDVLTTTESGLEFMSYLICDILKLSHDDFTFELVHTDIGINENVVKSVSDIVIENVNMIVNLEMNTSKGKKYERKNNNYICQLVLRQTRKSKDYNKPYKKVYQININSFGVTDDNRSIVRSRILDDETYQEIHPMFEIYDINIAKLRDMSYTEISKKKRSWENLLYILVCDNKSDLTKMYKGDDLMAEVVKNIKSKVDDFDKFLIYNREVLDDGNQLEDTFNDGIRLGMDRGIKQTKIETAQAMLKKNYDISVISDITNLSKEEVLRLKEELK